LEPLAKGRENGGFALRELLRTICLRRDTRLLQLPKPQFELVEVTLRQEERALYNRVLAQCARDIDEVVSSRAKIKKYGILFATIMKLRRLCNHGASNPLLATNSDAETGPGLDIEQGCEFCSGADEDRFELVNQDSFCSECGRELLLMTNSQASAPRIALEAVAICNEPPTLNGISDTTMSKGVSAKAQAVINRLEQTEHGSKR
jgi:SWI/SNF-related matrix-associated actin-dependent regulator of chromatin subfamily A3